MFTNSEAGQPEAAWFNVNNAHNGGQRNRDLVAAGYMVRISADEETKQAREGDWSLQEAAFASGTCGHVARRNPISAPEDWTSIPSISL